MNTEDKIRLLKLKYGVIDDKVEDDFQHFLSINSIPLRLMAVEIVDLMREAYYAAWEPAAKMTVSQAETEVRCTDCGIKYGPHLGLDLVLPDQQWKVIFPEESGFLCANCICKRAAKLGGTCILAWVENMDYGDR